MLEKSKLGHDTLVPISFVMIIIWCAFWITQIYAQSNANAVAISKHEVWEEKMERRVYLIMGALKIKDPKDDE